MDKPGYAQWQEAAMEIMDAGRRIFADGDRFASGWFHGRSSSRYLREFVCAVSPTSAEVDALDRLS